MMYCSKCGTRLPDEANYCWKCGLPQKEGVSAEEPKWEVCRIRSELVRAHFFGYPDYRYYVEATGPKGVYRADYSIEANIGKDQDVKRAVASLVEALIRDGWEPREADPRLAGSYMFRRRTK